MYESVPAAFGGDRERVVWADDGDEFATLTPSDRSGTLPEATFAFRLANDRGTRLWTNAYGWKLLKRVDGAWYLVAPTFTPLVGLSVASGSFRDWWLTLEREPIQTGERTRSTYRQESVDGRPVDRLRVGPVGGGTYAFGVPGGFEGDGNEGSEIDAIHAAEFELAGDPLVVTPTDDVASVEDRGTEVVVRLADDAEFLDADFPRATYEVTKVSPDEATRKPTRKIPEQLAHTPELWNAVANFEPGVERVRILTRNATEPPFGMATSTYFAFDGETYRIETRRPE
ncbi:MULTISPECIES: hypothetical protein [Halorussus]|uniref:hypothetical protein n=1 Tax=Halorussus TaxID=1070314 RepID=UPI00209E9D4B|nr:hypothetical protein [Halorussus vallis]USZ76095.1 hypothetical protein NGM07_01930 [Halorussus vallis]